MSGLSILLRWCRPSSPRARGAPAPAHSSARAALPINLNVGHLFHLAGQPINLSSGIRYTATAGQGEAQWGVRLTMTLLFPG